MPLLMDGHVHITNRVYYEGIDTWKAQRTGLWDYARARQGGANVVIENIAPYGYQDYNGTVKQVARLIETFHRVLDANRDKMELALTAADVRRITASGKMAVILGIESGFDQEGDIDVLRLWHRMGVRLIQFAGQSTTAYADSSVRGAVVWKGINERGRRLIAEMNRLGIMIDITHATEDAQRQIIEASRAPVVASHTALKAVCDNPANMPDDILRAVAAKGGLVGIHSTATVISQRYFDWSKTHPAAVGLAYALLDAHDTEPRLVKPRDSADATYLDALDARLGDLWKKFYARLGAKTWRNRAARCNGAAGRRTVGPGKGDGTQPHVRPGDLQLRHLAAAVHAHQQRRHRDRRDRGQPQRGGELHARPGRLYGQEPRPGQEMQRHRFVTPPAPCGIVTAI